MDQTALERVIDDAFERRAEIGPDAGGPVRAAVDAALDGLDAGRFRVAQKQEGGTAVVSP
jgi:2,3,4,5-tetrahydropyridine-2-carboxylate N-succinyltransferase